MVAGTSGTIELVVRYTSSQIQEILRDRARQDLAAVNGKDPVGSSTVKFSGQSNHDDTNFDVDAVVSFNCTTPNPNRK
jgi:hypothetical protein